MCVCVCFFMNIYRAYQLTNERRQLIRAIKTQRCVYGAILAGEVKVVF